MKPNTAAGEVEAMYSGQEAGVQNTISGLRWWMWAAGAILLGVAVWLLLARGKAHDPAAAAPVMARQAIPVGAAQAHLGDFNRYLTALGAVTPFYTVTVKTRVDGELIKVNFKEGQSVKQGDLLAEVDPRPFQVMLGQAEGQLERDKASLVNAQVTFDRDKILFTDHVLAKQDLDNQDSLVGQYKGAIVTDQANIANAKLQLVYSRITAPITGRIGLRLVDPGNIIHATDTQGLAVITQLQPIAVLFSIPEDDLPKVLSDLKAGNKLPVDAYDRALSQKLATGSLLTLDNEIDPNTGTIRLKAMFANTDNSLFPNQFVNVKLLVETRHQALLIPSASVQRTSRGSFVYVVRQDETVDVRNVKVGGTQGDVASIDTGLSPGEYVVTDGIDKLQQGSRVRVQAASEASNQR